MRLEAGMFDADAVRRIFAHIDLPLKAGVIYENCLVPPVVLDDIDMEKCWMWTGTRLQSGGRYPIFAGRVGGEHIHTAAYRLLYVIIRDKVLERTDPLTAVCGETLCVNPHHYELSRRWPDYPLSGSTHHQAKLTEDDVRGMLDMYEDGANYSEIARKFGIEPRQASSICRGQMWAHVFTEYYKGRG